MSHDDKRDPIDRMVDAYENMLERVDNLLSRAEESTIPTLKHAIEHAKEKAVELNELTHEEAEKISTYLERDMHDAAHYLSETGEEFREWFRFDLQLIEKRLFEMFAGVADKTCVELSQLAQQAREASFYHSGEITGPGTLICVECGKVIQFHKTGHIPPCSACSATMFKRSQSSGVN